MSLQGVAHIAHIAQNIAMFPIHRAKVKKGGCSCSATATTSLDTSEALCLGPLLTPVYPLNRIVCTSKGAINPPVKSTVNKAISGGVHLLTCVRVSCVLRAVSGFVITTQKPLYMAGSGCEMTSRGQGRDIR